jgi:raffinose/stachyose/melibiose transport system substrate-binding protein
MPSLRPMTSLLSAIAAASLAVTLAGCSSGSSAPADSASGSNSASAAPITIRVAMGSTGPAVDGVFTALKAAYEKKYPGRTLELIVQENDTYETIGLNNLLTSRNAPDVYFERPGARLATRVDDGYGADITEAVNGPEFAGRFDAAAYSGMVIDGKTYMVPWSGDVTNVFWYNKAMFTANGLTPPTTWDEFLALCAKLKAAGITPLVDGNKDKWTVGSIASHLAERSVGNDAYVAAIKGEAPMNSPGMVAAFDKLKTLADNGYINRSVDALPDDQATTQFLLGKAAMLGIGSWLISDQTAQAPTLQIGYFNMPTMDGSGDQQSVLGVSTGYMVNANSENIAAGIDFLAMVSSVEGSKLFAAAGITPMTVDPFVGVTADPNTVSLASLLSSASTKVTPADNIDVKRADEFYGAAAAVIGGLKSPQDALDQAQHRVEALPKS